MDLFFFKIRKREPVFFLFIIGFLFASGCFRKDDVYDALLIDLPLEITTDNAEINIVYYILKQTHEPLFKNTKRNL